MKKTIFVKDITRPNLEVNDYFVVAKKGILSTKTNIKYISVSLRDKTGAIEGKVWERADELGNLFEKNDVVQVKSRSKLYQEKPQLTISDIRKVEDPLSLEDMKEFFPKGEKEHAELQKEYFTLVEEIKDPHLLALLRLFSGKKEMFGRFCYFPASVGVHHVYVGGLLEHSLSVARMGKEVHEILGGNRDVIVAGCILHDVGKIDEIMIKGGFRYSDKGRLLGHISLGLIILEGLIGEIEGFSVDVADALAHIVVSHHGVEEWGSPKKPMCAEALIVHYLDNLDARVMGVREHMRDNMEDEKWTEYHRLYESRFFKLPEK